VDFKKINTEIKNENLTLKPITINDKDFIVSLFQDKDIVKYYIVPKEAQQDFRRLLEYWFNDIQNGAGSCFIIFLKGSGLFSNSKPCGFISFEFRNTLQNAMISYSIHPKFRNKGIATKATKMLLGKLEENGILSVEADIDKDNLISENIVKKLGFTTDKRQALVDPEMFRDGEVRMRGLWKKNLKVIKSNIINEKIPINANIQQLILLINKIVEEINSNGKHTELMLKYYYFLGRIKFLEGNYEESRSAFGQCNYLTSKDGVYDSHLYFYWLGEINKIEGKLELAKSCYLQAIKNFCNESEDITKKDIENALDNLIS